MSDWTVHLEFEEGTSSKFWRARVEGKTLYVNYGKIGSNGQTQVKDFASPDVAQKEYDKLVREKRNKGYQDAGGGGGGGGDEDEENDNETGDDAGDEDEGGGDGDGDGDDEPIRVPKARPRVSAPGDRPAASAAPSGRTPDARLLLEVGSRKVETKLWLDGKSVRMESSEAHASPDAAKKAYDRLLKMLGGEGYKQS